MFLSVLANSKLSYSPFYSAVRSHVLKLLQQEMRRGSGGRIGWAELSMTIAYQPAKRRCSCREATIHTQRRLGMLSADVCVADRDDHVLGGGAPLAVVRSAKTVYW